MEKVIVFDFDNIYRGRCREYLIEELARLIYSALGGLALVGVCEAIVEANEDGYDDGYEDGYDDGYKDCGGE